MRVYLSIAIFLKNHLEILRNLILSHQMFTLIIIAQPNIVSCLTKLFITLTKFVKSVGETFNKIREKTNIINGKKNKISEKTGDISATSNKCY